MTINYQEYMESPEFLKAQVVALAESVDELMGENEKLRNELSEVRVELTTQMWNKEYIVNMVKFHLDRLLGKYCDDNDVIALDYLMRDC